MRRLLRRGLVLSVASIGWTIAASSTEITLGLRHHILSLVVFGCAGVLDAAGSATLVVHFRHALRHDELAERHERRATLIVSIGLIALGLGSERGGQPRRFTCQDPQSGSGSS